uniref:hypothetical protein 1 n=1 Tax=Moniliophthora perniciosa TaxID=153609 RepID=UPI000024232D|nr:hypothetical protein 1 [Moniliophthora perniciosa]AAQ74291.1 hypothetical protein 1 [Moniliophthora perniciosa]
MLSTNYCGLRRLPLLQYCITAIVRMSRDCSCCQAACLTSNYTFTPVPSPAFLPCFFLRSRKGKGSSFFFSLLPPLQLRAGEGAAEQEQQPCFFFLRLRAGRRKGRRSRIGTAEKKLSLSLLLLRLPFPCSYLIRTSLFLCCAAKRWARRKLRFAAKQAEQGKEQKKRKRVLNVEDGLLKLSTSLRSRYFFFIFK